MSDDYFIKGWFEIPSASLKDILVPKWKNLVVHWERAGKLSRRLEKA